MANSSGRVVEAIAMRDTDCDLTSVLVARIDSGIRELTGLRGGIVAVGAFDSPQATLLPLACLRASGLTPDEDFEVRMFDVLPGKHGDHVGGERSAALALAAGQVDAACMLEANYRMFQVDGVLDEATTTILARTNHFDHCNFTVSDRAPVALVARFRDLLLEMSYDDPDVRPLLELEGLTEWRAGRTAGYDQLEEAVDRLAFYDESGAPLVR
jgi:ABC-type phosphate/phosphonate transport system substrate-binding protein